MAPKKEKKKKKRKSQTEKEKGPLLSLPCEQKLQSIAFKYLLPNPPTYSKEFSHASKIPQKPLNSSNNRNLKPPSKGKNDHANVSTRS